MIEIDRSAWRRVRFGDVVQSVTDRVDDPASAGVDRYVGLEHLDAGSLTINRWGSPSDVGATKLRFGSGDVIFARRRAYQRKLGMADFEGIASAHSLVLRARPGKVLPEFLPVFLSSDVFMDRAIQISVGSLSPTVNWKTLAVQEFDLPPLDEQRRIASLIWAAEDACRAAQHGIESIETVLHSLRATHCAVDEAAVPLESVAEILDRLRVPVNEADRALRLGDVPYYGAGGQVGWIDKAVFDEPLVLVGEDATLAVYRVDGPSWVNNHAHVLRATTVPRDWLFHCLKCLDLGQYSTNGTRLKLTLANLKRIQVPFPPDLEFRLADLRGLEKASEAARKRANAVTILKRTAAGALLRPEAE